MSSDISQTSLSGPCSSTPRGLSGVDDLPTLIRVIAVVQAGGLLVRPHPLGSAVEADSRVLVAVWDALAAAVA